MYKRQVKKYLKLDEEDKQSSLVESKFFINEKGSKEDTGAIITSAISSYFESIGLQGPKEFPLGMLFPTRPFNVHDLYLFIPKPFEETNAKHITKILLAHRGFKSHDKLPLFEKVKGASQQKLTITNKALDQDKVRIGVSSWKTPMKSWVANVTQKADPNSLDRLIRLCALSNQILKLAKPPRYLIFPELSIPPAWFMPVAMKLRRKGVHLIAGVEYHHDQARNTVRNQVWAALSYDGLDFPVTVPYVQDKLRAAIHEEKELWRYGGKRLEVPKANDSCPCEETKHDLSWDVPPIIQHEDFYFSLLICSEFTNIQNRAPLTGKIDALIVPEWNQDTESFNALVESAAADIHAYIVQCNDRAYGDSRIRVPAKERHERDMIRIKGGLEDYFVVGEINVKELRQFQSSHRSPDKPFKPVPDGFKIAEYRKTLPKP